ncbi:MAG: type I toxin-antitoxin system toxin [Peptostreptococcaceae bacterium]
MDNFLFNIITSFLVGIPSSIVASYIFDKLKRHSCPTKSKSVFELDIKIKFRK